MRIALLTLLFMYSATVVAFEQIVLVGDAHHPPYAYLEEGQAKGIYVDLIRAAFKDNTEFKIKIKLVPWKRALYLVESGQSEGIFPPHFFPEQRPFLIDYSAPILNEDAVVYCNTESLSEKGIAVTSLQKWPDDFHNATFAISRGVKMGGEAFWEQVESGTVVSQEVEGPEIALLMLMNQRADCHINDRATIEWHLKSISSTFSIQSRSIAFIRLLNREAGYLALSEKLSTGIRARLLQQFNSAIEEMRSNGRYLEILQRYF